LTIGETEHLALLGHAVDPETVVLVRPLDRNAGLSSQRGHRAGVIDMAMGDQDAGQRQAFGLQRLPDAIEIAARIDDRRLLGLFAPENGAVLFERSNRNDLVAHNLPETCDLTALSHARNLARQGRPA